MGTFLSVFFGTSDSPLADEGVGTKVAFDNNVLEGDLAGRGGSGSVLAHAPGGGIDPGSVFGEAARCFAMYTEAEAGSGRWVRRSLQMVFTRGGSTRAAVVKFWAATQMRSPDDGGRGSSDGGESFLTLADHQVVGTGTWRAGQSGQTLDVVVDAVSTRRYIHPDYAEYAGVEQVFPLADTPDALSPAVLGALGAVQGPWEQRGDGVVRLVASGCVTLRLRYEMTPDPVPGVESLLIARTEPPHWLDALLLHEFPTSHPLASEWPAVSSVPGMVEAGVCDDYGGQAAQYTACLALSADGGDVVDDDDDDRAAESSSSQAWSA